MRETQTYVRSFCFEYGNVWSSPERGYKLQHPRLHRQGSKIDIFALEQGQGFVESADPPTQILVEVPPYPHTPSPSRRGGGKTRNVLLACTVSLQRAESAFETERAANHLRHLQPGSFRCYCGENWNRPESRRAITSGILTKSSTRTVTHIVIRSGFIQSLFQLIGKLARAAFTDFESEKK